MRKFYAETSESGGAEVAAHAGSAGSKRSADDLWRACLGPDVQFSCLGPDVQHVPRQKSAKSGGRKYVLFTAAQDGCLECVKHLVEREGVDVHSESTNCKYTALDFAEWSHQRKKGAKDCQAVIEYLKAKMGTSTDPVSVEQPGMVLDNLDKLDGVWARMESHDESKARKLKRDSNKIVSEVD